MLRDSGHAESADRGPAALRSQAASVSRGVRTCWPAGPVQA
jgi:hypothetical protein